ncbi:MAG TPA: hypothetical protein VK157_09435 [Phycisphaerales bacterium]|nr:hypothetical protein [Phycisphaerales bacterium]
MRKMCTTLGVSFTLLLAQAALAGDNCAAPTVVTAGTTPFDNSAATDDGTDAPCATFGGLDGLDLYFSYTPPSGVTTITVNTCGSGDTTLQVLSSCGGTSLACNDDSCGLSSQVSGVAVTAGTPVIIRVASWGGTPVPITAGVLTIIESGGGGGVANDNCSTAATVVAGSNAYDSTGATDDGLDASCAFGGADNADVWFRYVAPAGAQSISVDTGAGSIPDTTLAIFDACGGAEVACDDDGDPNGLRSRISGFPVVGGGVYFIRAASWDTSAGGPGVLTITESFAPPAAGDICSTALAITAAASPVSFDTSAAGFNPNAATSCGFGTAAGNDIFYSYTAALTGQTTLSFCGSGFDTVVEVFDACSGTSIACNDDSCGLQSEVSFLTTAGTAYIVQVDGYNGASGAGSFTITEVPAVVPSNDNCATATVAIAGSNPLNNTFATNDGLVASCAFLGGPDQNDVWFSYTATTTGFVQFDTLNSTVLDDTTLSIYDECGGTEIACNDDAGTGLLSRIVLSVTAGEDYFVRVASYDGAATGDGDLTITEGVAPPPANDLCTNAIAFTGSTASPITFDTTLAESEGTNPCGGSGPDIYYAYTASATGTALVSLCGSSFDSTLQVYDGCGGATVGGCSDDTCGAQSEVTICVTAGTTYIIQVDGFGGSSGVGQLAVTETPGSGTVANDECSGAIVANVGTTEFDNNCATGGSGPGTCAAGGADGADVWFSFTPTGTCYTIDTDASTGLTDTVIQLFDSCSATTAIGCDDDGGAVGLLSSLTVANLTPGQTYFIRVAGWGASPNRGAGTLTITDNGDCPCNPYVAAPSSAVAEAEVCGSDANGGCNMTTPTFEAITCGTTIAGTSWKDFAGAGLRDTDWYEFTISTTSDIVITGRSQFNPQLALINNQCGAGLQVLATNPAPLAGCSDMNLTVNDLPAGTYRVFVGMAGAQPDTLCGSGANDYWFNLTVNDSTAGVCDIDFNNNCVFPEDGDVIDFFNVLAGAECLTCDSIDFNRNAVFPEDQDVIDFFNVLAGAPCPY